MRQTELLRSIRYARPRPIAVVLCCSVVQVIFSTGSQAQTVDQPATVDKKPSVEFRVFELKHITGEDAEKFIRNLGDTGAVTPSIVSDSRGRVMISATPQALSQIEDLLTILDRPAWEEADARQVKILSLANADAASAAELLAQLFPETALSFDPRTNSVVVIASGNQLHVIEALVMRLDGDHAAPADGPTTRYQIEVFWLVESSGEEDGADGVAQRKPDPRLEEAVAELKTQGFQELRQWGQARVAAKSGASFNVSSSNSQGYLEASGALALSEQDDQQIELQLELSTIADLGMLKARAKMQTDIITQPRHNVVLGIAGATGDERRSAFVVRVEK